MFEVRRAKRSNRKASYPKNHMLNLSPPESFPSIPFDHRVINHQASPYLTHYQPAGPHLVDNCCRIGPANHALINNLFQTINHTREQEEEDEDEDEEEDYDYDDNYNDYDNYIDEKEDDDDEDEYNDAVDDIDDDEEDEHSDESSEDSNFVEKLEECMNKFRIDTDNDTEEKVKRLLEQEAVSNKEVVKPIHLRSPNCRRKSILPDSEMCKEVLIFNGTLAPNQNQMLSNEIPELPSTRLSDNCVPEIATDESLTNLNNSPASPNDTTLETEELESIKELKTLVLSNAVNQMQLKKIETDLEGAYDHYFQFSDIIRLKTNLIRDIQMNSDALQGAKEKFENRRKKLGKEIDKICKQLETNKAKKNAKQVNLCDNKKILYEHQLEDVESLNQIIDDSIKAISTLFEAIVETKEEENMLRARMKKEEERKEILKKKLEEDEKKILQLAEKLNVTPNKLNEIQSENGDAKGSDKSKTLKESLLEIGDKLSHLDYVLKEKSMDLERTTHTYGKENLRDEIRHLRCTRDRLLDEKCDLDEKFQKERTLSNIEERKRLEFGEAIEAIDAMIEHKNEMICGKKDFDESQSEREKGETILMERLAKLSDGEMRTLFCKYFLKVIDLKESSQSLELRTVELETVIEAQKWRVQTLTNALKLTKLAGETNFAVMQDQYQRDLLLIFKHFSQETGASDPGKTKVAKCKRKNERLTKLLSIYKHAVDTVIESNHVPSFLKDEIVKIITSLNNPLPTQIYNDQSNQACKNTTTTTKVTRQRNKLIIQKTTDSDKKKK